MQTIKEFGGSTPQMSVRKFWLTSGPVLAAILLMTVVIILWKRPITEAIRDYIRKKLGLPVPPRKRMYRVKERRPTTGKLKPHVKKGFPWPRREKISDPETPKTLVGSPPPPPGGESGG